VQVRQIVIERLRDDLLAPLQAIDPQLVLLFGSPGFFADDSLPPWLQRHFPNATRVGASTAGEISAQGVTRGSLVITAVHFNQVRLAATHTRLEDMTDCFDAGQRLARQLPRQGLRQVLLFAPGVDINGSALIDGFQLGCDAPVPISGGLAADDGAFVRTWLLHDDILSTDLVIAIGLQGDALCRSSGCVGGWQSFGPLRRATRAEGNVLYELDGQPALEIYKRYLGHHAEDLPASGLMFPLALMADEYQETGLIRTLLGIDENQGSLILAGDVPAGGSVRLMAASPQALVEGAEIAARDATTGIGGQGQRLALLVSCVGRRLVMGDAIAQEVAAAASHLGPDTLLAGFYSNGEISPHFGMFDCKLHNQTMTIALLGEDVPAPA
jgi:hypothetical protein